MKDLGLLSSGGFKVNPPNISTVYCFSIINRVDWKGGSQNLPESLQGRGEGNVFATGSPKIFWVNFKESLRIAELESKSLRLQPVEFDDDLWQVFAIFRPQHNGSSGQAFSGPHRKLGASLGKISPLSPPFIRKYMGIVFFLNKFS